MKWNFKEIMAGDDYQGIRDGDIELFDKTRYQSVVREAIQNSLDARLSYNEPVTVVFNFLELEKSKHPEMTDVEKRLIFCKNWDRANEDDKELISNMIDSIEIDKYSCLVISDYNTIGMEVDSSFDSFARARNVSTKNNIGSAGSKGMGKAAYFAASYLHTLFVTSIYHKDNSCLFQGISRISTHKIGDKLYNYKGYYGDDFTPTSSLNSIPDIFKRSQSGTSIYIIGLWADHKREELMVKELLNNFWLAILEGDLIVQIGNQEFDKENIYDEVVKHFDNVYESGQYNSNPNPRPYIESYLEINCTNKTYSKNIPILGDVRFVIAQNDQYQGRIANFRKSKMLIYKDPSKLYRGYCGIFVCTDKKGNEILKKLENATHTEWRKGNWKDDRGREAIYNLHEYIKECIDDFIGDQHNNEITIPAFDKLLSLKGIFQSDGKTNTDKGDKKEKPKKPEKVPQGNSSYTPKSFHWLRNRVVKQDNTFKYIITMNSKHSNNKIDFELFVGSDDKSSRERVNIVDSSIGSFKDNTLSLNLNKGITDVEIILEDNIKHSIRLKEIKNIQHED